MKKFSMFLIVTVVMTVAAIIIALNFTGCFSNEIETENTSEQSAATETTVVSEFTLEDLDGNTVSLSSFQGKVVVLNFWATWCPPCRAEIPDFIEVFIEFKNKNVQFLGISAEEVDVIAGFVEEYGINYPILVDKTGEVHNAWKISAIPQTFILNINGEVVFEQLGMMSKSQLSSAISEALKQ